MSVKHSPRKAAKRASRPREVDASALRWVCPPLRAEGSPGATDRSMIGIIGQERAIRALKLGIELYGPGYNVFVCGITGTGRASTVQAILNRIKGYCPLPPDRCYVHNFTRPDEPRLLSLPRGLAGKLRADMDRFVRTIQADVSSLLESEEHSKKRARTLAKYESEGDRIIERFEGAAEKKGFALKRVRDAGVSRPELFPMVQGQAMPMAEVEKMAAEGKLARKKAEAIFRQYDSLRQQLEATARESRDLLSRMETEISDLAKQEVRAGLQDRVRTMAARYPGDSAAVVSAYLQDVLEETLANLDLFRRGPSAGASLAGGTAQAPPETAASNGAAASRPALQQLLERFRINVIFSSRDHGDCPVIVETHPSYRRLFGYFEKSLDQSGHWTTDYTKIRPGSLLAADGGYLVVTAEDLFTEPDVWKELKRTLISRSLAIMEERSGPAVPTVTIKPEPIPINVKVILIGQRESYESLLQQEPEFRKVFKVLADFDEEMDLTAKTLRQYAAFARKVCADEGRAELEAAAVAAIAEFGARQAGQQGKLSTRFGEIADLIREADYWRSHDGPGRRILSKHVRTAIRESRRRRGLPEEKVREMVRDGQIFIDVKGRRTGQVNGLIIQDTGDLRFGLPARITATVSPGTAGIINIEREALLSGRSHTKGVLIIGGFLRERFGSSRPVTLTASLAFEQSYAGVDGDSASSTEVYALMSALSGLPVRQGIAVTGSVDQKGDVQSVAGINDKIEGFFKICSVKGLTGEQGVIVPEANLRDLMLDDEVVEAVRRRRFHVYPVRTVEEGLEILTGVPSGRPDAAGRYPDGTAFRLVDDRLARFSEMVQRFTPSAAV